MARANYIYLPDTRGELFPALRLTHKDVEWCKRFFVTQVFLVDDTQGP